MNIWLAIILGGLITFGMRFSFIYLFGRFEIPETMRRALHYVPPAVLSAIILPELLIRSNAFDISFNNTRLLAGLVFCLGLILVVVGGAELFTGNNLIVMAFASGRITLPALLRNWIVVYLGNFVGALLTAYLMFLSGQYAFGNGAVGLTALNIGEAKTSLQFTQAIVLGIFCNALVCIAVWMCFSARSTVDKILAIVPPIAAFVAAGFEHSVANMYFIPIALFIKNAGTPAFFTAIQKTSTDFPNLTWGNFLAANLLPVTIGNIIGGAGLVAAVYWAIFLRRKTP